MEDPLKPKPVPLAAETVLWFEFLLDPHKITQHLQCKNPEPSAAELIVQFISMTPDTAIASTVVTPGSDLQSLGGANATTPATSAALNVQQRQAEVGLQLTRKQLALKILELKVATWLKWDLDALEKSLPVAMQLSLLRDLCTISYGRHVTIPFASDFDFKIASAGNERAARFALTIYHRLLLRLQLIKDSALKASRPLMYQTVDQVQQFLETPTQPSIEYLEQLCASANSKPFHVFHYDSFVTLDCDHMNSTQNYDMMRLISPQELRAQLHYELAHYYLHTKQYMLAREAAAACNSNLQALPANATLFFCHIRPAELEGLLQACGISAHQQTLLERFHQSLLNNYTDIVPILRLDNRAREIPLVSRRNVELDIEGAISTGLLKETRLLLLQVAALNVVRTIFEWGNIFGNVEYFEKYRDMDCMPPIVEAMQDALTHCSAKEQTALKHFLIDCVLHQQQEQQQQDQSRQLLLTAKEMGIFSAEEMLDLDEQLMQSTQPVLSNSLATLNDWICHSKMTRVDVAALERQLITCSTANSVRILLVKLCGTAPGKPLWAINPSWDVPQPLKALIMAMPVSFLQDFSYVLLGKARELATRGNYIDAVSMLSVLKSETQRQELGGNAQIMCKLITWEILHIQVTQCLEEWHQKPLDLTALGGRCKQCLAALQAGDAMMPRMEILESCAIMLLNLTEFPALLYLDKRAAQLEFPLAFASTFVEMEKMKGPKKACRDAWELMLSMFLNVPKRAASAAAGSGTNSSLQAFLQRVRHQSVFGLAISMLGKMHNILKDDPNHDLNCEYMQLWPITITNPNSYSLRSVCETLQWLLSEALSHYPQTISWLKMKGDLELAIGNNESAMRCYVNALVTGTDYCTLPLQRNVVDDYVIRKMIRCAANLGCHMQATVLCQFLEEIDYGIVFKNLSEKSSNFTDAMDAYYSCIWDTTLLEFIVNLHAKRGEHSRKLEAISMMGTLELNANNNEEIKRESAMVRKSRFLRSLAKQYLL
ncbi:integrator complex subunit 8 [Drosophila sulfurigaster albostrigata]|uniref:integrator complex subunit 8 n=1 Tax=Drosophila sulfurigaster albostrigata TaxID=89887 RepID=UPI002D21AEF6|nr:integrator complex subunit 8 [Drosophila sulfurigaster albostrigata]